ncbi:hypothetical protein [Pseudonocardia sp. GCM10023141]|uniref:hypothetical protein n=1 Tax=Pseudonocardia sp. GCM10023141 TaxID=3252653 RepID=UPI003623E42A
MTEPSTAWREVLTDGEAERHERQAAQFSALQKQKSEKFGNGRALHRRQRLGLRATFEVLDDLPEPARHGLFARPGSHDALLRLSNGGFNSDPDKVPDVRGFSIKVLDVDGTAVLGGGPAVSQDFALINHAHFSSPTSETFAKVVTAAGATPGALLGKVLRSPGLVPQLLKVAGALKTPFTGFATQDFYSAAPLACGPYAVRVRLQKASDRPSPTASDDWPADVFTRLADAPLVHLFQVQFFVDEQSTPIEDAAAVWTSPFHTVARLTIPQQERDAALDEEIENARFDPWNALTEHRPLGEVMRARKVAYYASQQNRGAK